MPTMPDSVMFRLESTRRSRTHGSASPFGQRSRKKPENMTGKPAASANLIHAADRSDERYIRQGAVALVYLAVRAPDARSFVSHHAGAKSAVRGLETFGTSRSELDRTDLLQ